MEQDSTPEREQDGHPGTRHAIPDRLPKVASPLGYFHSSELPHVQQPVPGGLWYADGPAQDPDGHYCEVPRSPMQEMPMFPYSQPPLYPWRRLPTPVPSWRIRLGPTHYFQPCTPNHHSLRINELLNPVPEPRDEAPAENVRSNIASPETMPETRMASTGDTTQSENSDTSATIARAHRENSSSQGLPIRGRQKQTQIATFTEVAAHTAKCDECNRRNKDGMTRCNLCGWQCCRGCLAQRSGNRSHVSSTGFHVPEESESPERAEQPQLPPAPSTALSPTSSTLPQHLSPDAANTAMPSLGSPREPLNKTREMEQQEQRNAAETLIEIRSTGSSYQSSGGSPRVGSGVNEDGASGEFGSRESSRKRARLRAELADDPLDMQKEKRPRVQEDTVDVSLAIGEEFENPRRNPSRRARPIDMKE